MMHNGTRSSLSTSPYIEEDGRKSHPSPPLVSLSASPQWGRASFFPVYRRVPVGSNASVGCPSGKRLILHSWGVWHPVCSHLPRYEKTLCDGGGVRDLRDGSAYG